MNNAPAPPRHALEALRPRDRGRKRALLWSTLVLLLVVAQTLLVILTVRDEATRAQEDTEGVVLQAAVDVRRQLLAAVAPLQTLASRGGAPSTPAAGFDEGAQALMRSQPSMLHVERRSASLRIEQAVSSDLAPPLFEQLPRSGLGQDAEAACLLARRQGAPVFSRSYFVPMPGGMGMEVIDLCLPQLAAGRDDGYIVATFGLPVLIERLEQPPRGPRVEFAFVDSDGTLLARARSPRGAGVYRAVRLVDLPGGLLHLRGDSTAGHPSLIPNLTLALVLGLSVALFTVVLLLARDGRRRARAESALADAFAFRRAMEDSLITGLRARDLEGRLTYANPAFCRMVGFDLDTMRSETPPYWPPEHAAEYLERQQARLGVPAADIASLEQREGFETVFMRRSGERFPVMIYEAPLVDSQGHHKGWMSTVLDMTAQRRMEELSRQQQDRLQATARLATVGEMASLLSHELNQPLAAIASYATGSLNLMDQPDEATPGMVRQGLVRIAEQAERAGRVIKSVHSFVRRREQLRENIGADQLIDTVLPLVKLQARKSGTRVEVELPGQPPHVLCDRTMVEQVLLNLTRNAIQAMESATPLDRRKLQVKVRRPHAQWVAFDIVDAGPGVAQDVAAKLFTPFFTTRSEGMGLGLSLCRTVVEQHGGMLDFGPREDGESGTRFSFTLPAARTAESRLAGQAPA